MLRASWVALALTLVVGIMALYLYTHTQSEYGVIGATDVSGVTACAAGLDPARYDTVQSPAGTDYIVPAGSTLVITHLIYSGAIGATVSLGYGTGTADNATEQPEGAVFLLGTGDRSSIVATGDMRSLGVFASIPAGHYPFVAGSSTGDIQIFGVEQ